MEIRINHYLNVRNKQFRSLWVILWLLGLSACGINESKPGPTATIKMVEQYVTSTPPQYEKATATCEKIIELRISEKDYEEACHALFIKAYAHELSGNVAQAYKSYTQLENWIHSYEVENVNWLQASLNNRGLIHRNLKQYHSSIPLFLKAMNLTGLSEKKLANVTYNLGLVYRELDDGMNLHEAIRYFRLSMEYAKKANYPRKFADVLEQLARIHILKEEYDSAALVYQQAIDYAVQNDLTPSLGKIYHNWAFHLYNREAYAESESAFLKALEHRTVLRKRALTHIDLGSLYYRQGRMEEAVKSWETAVDLGFDEFDQNQTKVLLRLAAHYWQSGEKATGDSYGKKYEEAMDRLNNAFEEVKLAHNQQAFNKQLDTWKQSQKEVENRRLMVVIIGICVILGIFMFLWYRRIRAKHRKEIKKAINSMIVP